MTKTNQIIKMKVAPGIYWVEVPEADFRLLCGAPADAVKHLRKERMIRKTEKNGVPFETGPNAILLSDWPIQNGTFANMTEFPVLQMLYLQGLIIPNHPNNQGKRPLLIGKADQLQAQLGYIHRGNYGLINLEEMEEAGMAKELAETNLKIKLNFAFGKITPPEKLLDCRELEAEPLKLENGITIARSTANHFQISYGKETVDIDLSLAPQEKYHPPYELSSHFVKREDFAVIHSGSGDGWDTRRPCMASILIYRGKIFLIDAGPHIIESLLSLGISVNEVEGVFHTHAHDDHFAGLTSLIRTDHRLKYYSSSAVRFAVQKKLSSLLNQPEEAFFRYFEVVDLPLGGWSSIDGLQVKPTYSPHPIETNIFFFRDAQDPENTLYGHFADIVSERVWKGMTAENAIHPIPEGFHQQVMQEYSVPCRLKKIDAGGGMIHGDLKDFSGDQSERIVIAHTSSPLKQELADHELQVPFGTVDVFASASCNYEEQLLLRHLHFYFPELRENELRELLQFPLVQFSKSANILSEAQEERYVYLSVRGTSMYTDEKSEAIHYFPSGSLIGIPQVLGAKPHSYKACSHTELLQIPLDTFSKLLADHHLMEVMKHWETTMKLLWNSWLFGEVISFPVMIQLIRLAREVEFSEVNDMAESIYFISEGNLKLGRKKLQTGDFFGGESYFLGKQKKLPKQEGEARLIRFPANEIANVPILFWKVMEAYQKR